MIKYLKQRDESSCGPVAIINIFKWLDFPITYDFLPAARYLSGWVDHRTRDGGVNGPGMEKALKRLGIKRKRKFRPKLREINRHLDNGGIVLFDYNLPFKLTPDGHFALCIERTDDLYLMVNVSGSTLDTYSKDTMKKVIRTRFNEDCCAWFIKK